MRSILAVLVLLSTSTPALAENMPRKEVVVTKVQVDFPKALAEIRARFQGELFDFMSLPGIPQAPLEIEVVTLSFDRKLTVQEGLEELMKHDSRPATVVEAFVLCTVYNQDLHAWIVSKTQKTVTGAGGIQNFPPDSDRQRELFAFVDIFDRSRWGKTQASRFSGIRCK